MCKTHLDNSEFWNRRDKTDELEQYFKNDLFSVETLEDHEAFLKLLSKYRETVFNDSAKNGAGFNSFLQNALSVGKAGMYSAELRFLYELIQNVDDCKFPSDFDRHLRIDFDYSDSHSTITLEYNECGFTPLNVFSITGISETVKNHTDTMEIGEKGIGFKSVFGIANRVYIRSGYFSFYIDSDKNTIPHPDYDKFEKQKGTKIVLLLRRPEDCKKIFDEFRSEYGSFEKIFKKNPLVFLNKLSSITLHASDGRYIALGAKRSEPIERNGLLVEEESDISIDMNPPFNKKTIKCVRYTKKIVYNKTECESRYGKEILFDKKEHTISVIVPLDHLQEIDGKGHFYSFLPTSIGLQAPILLHAPFKLSPNREQIDDQHENEWYNRTKKEIEQFWPHLYEDLSKIVKENLIFYIPVKDLFPFTCQSSLRTGNIGINSLKTLPIIYCTDKKYHSILNVRAFSESEQVTNQLGLYNWLGYAEPLFIPPKTINLEKFGFNILKNVDYELLYKGLQDSTNTSSIFQYLTDKEYDITSALEYYNKFIERPPVLDQKILLCINNNTKVYNQLSEFYRKRLTGKMSVFFSVSGLELIDEQLLEILRDALSNLYSKGNLNTIIQHIKINNYKFYSLDGPDSPFALLCRDGVVLAKGQELGSIGSLLRQYDPKCLLDASLTLLQAEKDLNAIDKIPNEREYFEKLVEHRTSFHIAFKNQYSKFVSLIENLNTSSSHYILELLQNADDCTFDKEIPTFTIKCKDDILETYCNEKGFSREDVKSITDIANSSKLIEDKTGEMGIGFKSVFKVSDLVEIHSRIYHFQLESKTPTVPKIIDPIDNSDGTKMIFKLKKSAAFKIDSESLVSSCICLHHLQDIHFDDLLISIRDTPKGEKNGLRTITIGKDKTYKLDRYVHKCKMSEEAKKERFSEGRAARRDKEPTIFIYVPRDKIPYTSQVYTPSPIGISIKNDDAPIFIDAPLHLTPSREGLKNDTWNWEMAREIYVALSEMFLQRPEEKLKVLRFVGYSYNGYEFKWYTFSNDLLNGKQGWTERRYWIEVLSTLPFIPLLGSGQLVSAKENNVPLNYLAIPQFIAKLQERDEDIQSFFDGKVIDLSSGAKYWNILEKLGCIKAKPNQIFNCLNSLCPKHLLDKPKNSTETSFRDKVYALLSNDIGKDMNFGTIPQEDIRKLKIIPLRTRSGTQFTSYNEKGKLFLHEKEYSDENYSILDKSLMSVDSYYKIYGKTADDLVVLTQEAKYEEEFEKIKQLIYDKSKPINEIAEKILVEYENPSKKKFFEYIGPQMRDIKDDIPLVTEDGDATIGSRFINASGTPFCGKLVKHLCIDKRYYDFACNYLKINKDILSISIDDIEMCDLPELIKDDVEDLKEFKRYRELIRYFYEEGLIPDNLIAECEDLYFLRKTDDYDGTENGVGLYLPFPIRPVEDIAKLSASLSNQFNTRPNKYQLVAKIFEEDENNSVETGRKNYLLDMYANGTNQSFCQICKKAYPNEFTECHRLELRPKYAWNETNVNLCYSCTTKFDNFKKKPEFNKFIEDILAIDDYDEGAIDIPFEYDKSISFTAKHLAEIQIILRLEGYPDKVEPIDDSSLPDGKRYFKLGPYIITKS